MSFSWNCPKCSTGMINRGGKLTCPVCSKIGLVVSSQDAIPPNKKPAGQANGKKTTNDTGKSSGASEGRKSR